MTIDNAERKIGAQHEPPPAGFDWLDINGVRQAMGDCARSTVYEDPELQALAVRFAEPGRRAKRVRWLRPEVNALVVRRLEQRDAEAETVKQETIARRERRKAKHRITGEARARAPP
jgi:hypothetical protein